jgi:hypothetical protein
MMRIELLNSVAAQVNSYQSLRPSKGYDYQSYRKRQIFERLTQGVHYVYNNAVEGDIVEFGTSSGFSSLTIAHAMRIYSETYPIRLASHRIGSKTLHLYDSFRGLPNPDDPIDAQSPNVASGMWKEGTFGGLNKDELFALCAQAYDRNRINVVEGFYSTTLAGIASDTRFAMGISTVISTARPPRCWITSSCTSISPTAVACSSMTGTAIVPRRGLDSDAPGANASRSTTSNIRTAATTPCWGTRSPSTSTLEAGVRV